MKNKPNYLAILIFYVIAIALRYLTNKTALLDHLSDDLLKALLQGIGPAIGAAVACLLFEIKLPLSLKGNYKTIVLPFALYSIAPVTLICSIQYMVNGTISTLSILAILLYGLFEEIGWRSFLRPQLSSLHPLLNITIVASLWFIWHLNFELTISNLLFLGILTLGSWGIGKVADSTHSLLAVSAFHSLNNFFSELSSIKIFILVSLLVLWIISLLMKKNREIQELSSE